MTSRLDPVLDVIAQGTDELITRAQQARGGTDNRRPAVRNVAGLWCVDSDPMQWGLGVDVALDVLGLGPRVLGPKG